MDINSNLKSGYEQGTDYSSQNTKKYRLDFVGVGPTRTGTTWIQEYLLRHKDVCLPQRVKELHFFNNRYNKGFDWYFSHFPHYDGNKIIGEITPNYFHIPEAAQRVYDFNPNCKIICTLRYPVERSFSHYLHAKRNGYVKPSCSFREAMEERPSIIESSRYYTHLSRWLKHFGGKNVCILMFEDLKKNSRDFARKLCNFLELEEQSFPEELEKPVNEREFPINFTLGRIARRVDDILCNYRIYFIKDMIKTMGLNKVILGGREINEKLSEEDKRYVSSLLKEETENLEKLLNLDTSSWKKYQ